MNIDSSHEGKPKIQPKSKRQASWLLWTGLGLTLVIAAAGIVYGWQSKVGAQQAHQGLATAQAARLRMSNQAAFAESTAQAALKQQALSESQTLKAQSAQAAAESAAQQSATAEAVAVQVNESLMEQTRLATSRELARAAVDMLTLDPQLSAHLALQAIEVAYTFEAENALHQVLPELHPLMALLGTVGRIPYSPDGKRIALTNDDGYVSIVDTQNGEVQLSWQAHTGKIWNAAWSSDGERLATSSIFDTAKTWEAATGRLLLDLPISDQQRFYDIAWNPDDDQIIANSEGFFTIWDADTGKDFRSLDGNLTWFAEVIYSPDGRKVAAGDAGCGDSPDSPDITCNYYVIIWDAVTGRELFRLPPDSGEASNLGGKQEGFASPARYTLEMKSYPSGGQLPWQVSSGWFPYITSSNNLKRAGLSGDDDLAMVWDASAGDVLYEHRSRHSYGYWSTYPSGLAFSPDSQRLAVGVPGGTIILWKLTDSGAAQDVVLTQQGSSAGIESIAFSPDGTLLAVLDASGTTRVFDVESTLVRWETAAIGATWYDHVSFSPDGTRLVSSSDGVTTVHLLLLDELVELVRAHIIRPMTSQECLTYLHQDTCPAWP